MTKHDRERLGRLIKRRDWLEQRIVMRKSQGEDITFDDAERSALTWAVDIIAAHLGERDAI